MDRVEVAAPGQAMILRLLWLNGMIVGGSVAKSLDEVVVLGDVAGIHVGGRVHGEDVCHRVLPWQRHVLNWREVGILMKWCPVE